MSALDKFNLFIGIAALWFNYLLNINTLPPIAGLIIAIMMLIWFVTVNITNFEEYKLQSTSQVLFFYCQKNGRML